MTNSFKPPGFVKIVGIISGLLFVCLVVGLLVFTLTAGHLDNKNYALNDAAERKQFEDTLNEQEIPFEKISNNVYSVEKDWSKQADDIFQIINK